GAAGQREGGVVVGRAARAEHRGEAVGDGADRERRVEHLVVEGEGLGGRGGGRQAQRGQAGAGGAAQRAGAAGELGVVDAACPEGLLRLLQLTVRADAGIAQGQRRGQRGGRRAGDGGGLRGH